MKINTTKGVGLDALKILVYGEPGVGKTSLAATTGERTLIISAEAGLLSVREHEIDFIDITTTDDGKLIPKEKRIERLGEVYQYLLTPEAIKKYRWVFIDSLSEINQNLLEQLQIEFPERKDSLVLYGELSKRMRSLVKSFRDLPEYNVVFTALSTIEKDENSQRFTTISLVGSFAEKLPAYFDEVFYMHLSENKETNEQVRVLVTAKSDKLIAKDRSGMLEKIEKPNLGAIAKKIKNKKETVK